MGKSPSWRALSASLSVSDSIRGLAKKYSSDAESLLGLSSPELSPLAATPPPPASAARSQQSEGASPAMAPTPHHILDDYLQRNDLYESPGQARAGPAAAGPATAEQPVMEAQQAQQGASVPEEAAVQQARGMSSNMQPLCPWGLVIRMEGFCSSTLVQLLGLTCCLLPAGVRGCRRQHA